MKNNFVKKTIIFCLLSIFFVATGFSKDSSVDSRSTADSFLLETPIEKDNVEKWVYELFVNKNVKSVKKILKIPSDDYIFYGCAEVQDEDFAKLLAQKKAEQMALEKLNHELKSNYKSATFFGMEKIAESVVELSDEDEFENANTSYQVFVIYRISKDSWNATKKNKK